MTQGRGIHHTYQTRRRPHGSHPEFQRFTPPPEAPKGPRTSWWADATTREDFRTAQKTAQMRMSSTTETIKPADPNEE